MEAMALRRLCWIATTTNAFPSEKSGFRSRRCTFDSQADVIATLEEPKYRGDYGIFVLPDQPHGTRRRTQSPRERSLLLPSLTLRVYNAVTSARVIYTEAVASLSACQLAVFDADHCNAVQKYYGLRHISQVGLKLTEAGGNSHLPTSDPDDTESCTAAENHKAGVATCEQAIRFTSLIHGAAGECALDSCAKHAAPQLSGYPHPTCHIPLVITKTTGGIKAKVRTPLTAMQQEGSTLVHEQLNGPLLVYLNESVLRDGSAAYACVVPSVSVVLRYRLPSLTSFTVAELAAINLAADFLTERASISAAPTNSDSRAVLAAISPPVLETYF
ncbi:hypothetical protein MRX96_040744 [Rhipicephalus microplus]